MTIAERLIQKGFEKGALEVAREIACRLWNMGWPPERIQEATGLSGEELKKLFPDEQPSPHFGMYSLARRKPPQWLCFWWPRHKFPPG